MILLLLLCAGTSAFWGSDNSNGLSDCSGGHVKLNETCYILSKGSKRWTEAKDRCSSNGMTLARVDSQTKHDTVSQFLSTVANQHTFTWLDIKYSEDEDLYEHKSNGQTVQAFFWNHGEPSGGNERCVAQHAHGWADLKCENEQTFLCESQGCPFCSDVEVYIPDTTHCTDGGVHFNRNTCFFISDAHQTHTDASATCANMGGKLARLDHDDKYGDLYSYIGSLPYGKWKSFWGAETRNMTTGSFGTSIENHIWSNGEPNNDENNENCVQSWYDYIDKTYKWNDANCEHHLQYICEFADCDKDVCLATTTVPTTTTRSSAAVDNRTPSQTGSPSSSQSTKQPDDAAAKDEDDDDDNLLDLLKSKGHVVSAAAMTMVLCCLALLM